jgi:voltage-gated potassium channel
MAHPLRQPSPDRRRVYQILESGGSGDRTSTLCDAFLVVLILANVAAVVLATVPAYDEAYATAFLAFEIVSVAIFTLEYGLRLWVAPEHAPYGHLTPARARLAWALSPAGIVDLLAIAPFYAGQLVSIDLRYLRIFRLVRFLKLARYSTGLRSLVNAVHAERRALTGSFVILGGMIVTAAALAYLAEREAQPETFGSIPAAMWWAAATLTTVGYGDAVPVTVIGKALGMVVMLFGFAAFAVPVGIVATAFASEIHRRDFVVTWGMLARVPMFRELDADDMSEIMRLLHARTAQSGEVIATRGQPAHSMYFILSGAVEIDLGHEQLPMESGAFFGEIALLRKSTRSATVTATQRTNMLVLDAADFHSLMERRPNIAAHIKRVARERLAGERLTRGGDIVSEEIGEPAEPETPPRRGRKKQG